MNLTAWKQITLKFVVFSLVFILPLSGFGCKLTSSDVQQNMKAVTLEIWGVYMNSDHIRPIISDYRASHPYVQINYKNFRPEEYETALLNAMAEDRGPDIYLVHNTKVYEYRNKLLPLPASVKVAVVVEEGTIKKEKKVILQTNAGLTIGQLKKAFVDVVAQDVVLVNPDTRKEDIYGLPLSMDTLALYYNVDLLNRANLPEPPSTWNELQEMVPKLTKVDANDGVVQSAIALGLSDNIEHYFDILSALMLQNGTVFTSEFNQMVMDRIPSELQDKTDTPPAMSALDFYSSFAKPYKVTYTWDQYRNQAVREFAAGNLAMFVGYQFHNSTIKGLSPKLNYQVAPLPQVNPEYPVSYGNYWVMGVSKKSKASDIAWDFIQFATQADEVSKYLKASGTVTALKSLVKNQQTDELGVFANQVLTAKSWFHGADFDAVQKVFKQMVDDAATDNYESISALVKSVNLKLNSIYR
jgi:ABC-type glycerol-3-phosphate transport system substrate-binding protein